MPLNYDALISATLEDAPFAYSEKDSMLYALGVGFGEDPMDRRELPFVFEGNGLQTVPTLASMVLPLLPISGVGLDMSLLLHREEHLQLYRPLPGAARLLCNRRVTSVHDLGPRVGALITIESELRRAKDDTVLFDSKQVLIARGDGGFGGRRGTGPERHRLPAREADLSCDIAVRPDQALLFRLTGDMNPLHADPLSARESGFAQPILHGRCTYGIACRSILQTICDYDATLIEGFNAVFKSPVYPGDTLTTEMWQDRNIVSFRSIVAARNAVVLDNGKCTLAT